MTSAADARRLRRATGAPAHLQRIATLTRPTTPRLLEYLVARGISGATTTDVADALGVRRPHAFRLLRAAENVLFVSGEPSIGERSRGRLITWRADPARIAAGINDLRAFILGATTRTSSTHDATD